MLGDRLAVRLSQVELCDLGDRIWVGSLAAFGALRGQVSCLSFRIYKKTLANTEPVPGSLSGFNLSPGP